MSLPFDAALKDLLAPCPEDFAPVFQFPAIAPAQVLNVDLSTLSAATDVAFGFGDPLQEIVDLNFEVLVGAEADRQMRKASLAARQQVFSSGPLR